MQVATCGHSRAFRALVREHAHVMSAASFGSLAALWSVHICACPLAAVCCVLCAGAKPSVAGVVSGACAAGVPTTLPFHKLIMEHPKFVEGDVDTGFIVKYADDLVEPVVTSPKRNFVAEAGKKKGKR